jgi:hypothetical protein
MPESGELAHKLIHIYIYRRRRYNLLAATMFPIGRSYVTDGQKLCHKSAEANSRVGLEYLGIRGVNASIWPTRARAHTYVYIQATTIQPIGGDYVPNWQRL